MKSSLQRIRLGAVVLAVIVLVAIVGYRLAGYDWVESVWMTTVTISSVGYGERSSHGTTFQLFTVGVIIVGMSAAGYTVGGLVQMMFEGEFQRAVGHRRIARGIERLNDHVIICGYGRMGQVLADDLHRRKRPFVVVDENLERLAEAEVRQYLFVSGDATEEDTLLSAGVQRAKTLVTCLPTDVANVFITLTSRNLHSSIQIIARAEFRTSEKKLRQAGANKIVMPAITGGRQMARMITRPSTADLLELLSESSFMDVEMDEVLVPNSSPMAGASVSQTDVHRRFQLLVVAVKKADGEMVFGPGADYTFEAGDVVIVLGRTESVQRFRDAFQL
jgi:voltage-gated potassium channel